MKIHIIEGWIIEGCWCIVFAHGVRMGRQAGGRQEEVCPACISETVRCRKLILGREIGFGGIGVQRHRVTNVYKCTPIIFFTFLFFHQTNIFTLLLVIYAEMAKSKV